MIEAVKISKTYNDRKLIDDLSIKIEKGDFISFTGESGCGKTTLLNMLGLLDTPDSGIIRVESIEKPSKKQIMLLQREKLGYLFQNYALIENETVEKNLLIPLAYKKSINKKEAIQQALDFVNLKGFANRKIYELSGGEQQRIALARVFLKDAEYIFADEPTGNLDRKNRDIVFDILKELNNMGKSVVYVTHDIELANKADRKISM